MSLSKLGYKLPFLVLFVLGLFFIVQYYIPHPMVAGPKKVILQWKQPVGAFIIFTALLGLVGMHAKKVIKLERRWGYSAVTLISMSVMIFFGMFYGIGNGSVFSKLFMYLMTPIESTIFSLLAFFIASAAFRAFRARNVDGCILMFTAVIVMLGLVPIISDAFPAVGKAASFILKYPNTAAKRAIMMGVSLGMISTAVKIIFGFDKTILGRMK